MSPDIFQILTTLASVGAFGLVLKIERRLTRIETIMEIKQPTRKGTNYERA